MLGYLKISPYIVYLQIDDKDVIRDLLNDEPNINSNILIKRCKVIKIEHIATKETINVIERKMLNNSIQTFTENSWFNKNIYVFQTYERAFQQDFMNYKEHELFTNGYSGQCTTYYDNGQIEYDGYIINGKACGLCRKYFSNGLIQTEGTIINDQRNGEFKVFVLKPEYKLKSHCLYINNELVRNYLKS